MLLLDFKIDEQFLQSHKMSFSIPANSVKTYHLEEDRQLEFDDEFYFISKKTMRRSRNQMFYDIEASALWYRLGERGYSGNFTLSAVTPGRGLTLLMEAAQDDGLDWEIGDVSSSTLYYSLDVVDGTYLDLIRQWAKVCGCELVFDTKRRLVHMRETLGGNYGLSFRYERNLEEIAREEQPPAVTRLYPYGRSELTIAGQNNGSEYLEDYTYYTNLGLTLPQAQEKYRKDYRVQDDSFVDDVSLFQWAQSQMSVLAQPIINYRVKVTDLSDITGYNESNFGMGDFVVVEDEPLGIAVIARIVRRVRYPYEPERNEVELTTQPIALPDPNVQSGRSDTKNWELFVARNYNTLRQIGIGRTVLHRMPLIVKSEAEWIITYSIKFTCLETGTLQLRFDDDLHETTPFLPIMNVDCTAGEVIEKTISFASEDVTVDSYNFIIRAEMLGSSGLVEIQPAESNLWVHCRGIVRGSNPAYVNSITFNYTGAEVLWRVPDDVYEIEMEVAGSNGNGNTAGSGYESSGYGGGCIVTCKVEVIPGDYYAIRVGGQPWPNAGISFAPGGESHPGGGSTDIRLQGADITDCLIMAPGAGGRGDASFGNGEISWGGRGGFIQGGTGGFVGPNAGPGGTGATQSAPGLGGGVAGSGSNGSFMQGGPGWTGGFFNGAGGSGGGGWYGGGGGGHHDTLGGIGESGGGGGSGHADEAVYDLEYEDGANTGLGYLTIRWADPEAA